MPTRSARSVPALLVALLLSLAAGACGDDTASGTDESAGTSTTDISEPRAEPDPDSRAGSAADALVADQMPMDEASAMRVLDALPDELLGRPRQRSGGQVTYGAEGEADMFLEVMEAQDVGAGDETNRELLEMGARQEGRVVTDDQTDRTDGVMYIRGTEGSGAELVHFLVWTTTDGPYLFAAGAPTSDALDALVNAFAKAASSN